MHLLFQHTLVPVLLAVIPLEQLPVPVGIAVPIGALPTLAGLYVVFA